MEIKIKYHNSELEKLRSLTIGDWIDLRAAERVELKAGEFRLISLGVSMKLPEGYEAHIAPRSSSFAKWGFLQVNSVGVVDNSYAGTNDIWKLPVYATRDAVIEVASVSSASWSACRRSFSRKLTRWMLQTEADSEAQVYDDVFRLLRGLNCLLAI